MILLSKRVFGPLSWLCVFGVITASLAAGAVYKTYDCEYFSVEYPSDWDVEKKVSIANEGWVYNFGDFVSVTIGRNARAVTYVVPASYMENDSIFGENVIHFFETLNIKTGRDRQPLEDVGAHKTLENLFFSLEYPDDWLSPSPDVNTIRGTIVYTLIPRGDPSNMVALTILEDAVAFRLQTDRKGNIFSSPAKHIVDTLKFKY